MKLPHRRQFLHLAAGAAALPAVSRFARAQAYPSRPVRWIVGFPAGGGSDVLARLVAQWLPERLGQPFVIENRPGAGTNIATEAVVRAPPDGYTLLQTSTPAAINATLYNKLNFNVIQDIAPIAASPARPTSWRYIRLFQPRRFVSSSGRWRRRPGDIAWRPDRRNYPSGVTCARPHRCLIVTGVNCGGAYRCWVLLRMTRTVRAYVIAAETGRETADESSRCV
jgi:Tripartite tricarboxylate transporter family receptor